MKKSVGKIAGVYPVLDAYSVVGEMEVRVNERGEKIMVASEDVSISRLCYTIRAVTIDARQKVYNCLAFKPEDKTIEQALLNVNDEEVVSRSFSVDAINDLNGFLYKHFNIPSPRTFTNYEPYLRSLAGFLLYECGDEKGLNVLNLGSGLFGWIPFAAASDYLKGYDKDLSVTVSDLGSIGIPEENGFLKKGVFSVRQQDILEAFECLSEEERFNVVVANYLFDSVWAPEDARYERCFGNWYKKFYRLRVDPTNRKAGEIVEALRSGENEKGLKFSDISGAILIEEVVELVEDINEVPFGDDIVDYYSGFDDVRINFPGGIIKKVQEAFDFQLKFDGVFLLGATAVPDQKTSYENYEYLMGHKEVGQLPVQFKVDDYGLAKFILEQRGYDVKIYDFYEEFCNLSRSERRHLEVDISKGMVQPNGVQVMEVRKKANSRGATDGI